MDGRTGRRGSGWILFAAIALGVAGIMRIFDAIWAFRYHGVLPENLEGAIFGHSLKTYGWVWLVIAAIYIVCAFLVMNGSQFARWFGVAAAAIGALGAIWWMPYYPVWSWVYMAIGGLVIYALVVYGARAEQTPTGWPEGRAATGLPGSQAAGQSGSSVPSHIR